MSSSLMLIWEAKRVKLTLSGLAIHCDCLWLVWPLLLAFIAVLPLRKVFTITLLHRIKLFRNLLFRISSPGVEPNQFDDPVSTDSKEYNYRPIEVLLAAQPR